MRHRNVSNIRGPNVIWPRNFQSPKQIGINFVLLVFRGCFGLRVDRFDPHDPHQTPRSLPPDSKFLRNVSTPERGGLHVILVDGKHQFEVLFALPVRMKVIRRPGESEKLALA